MDQVDAGIHVAVFDLRIGADVGPPLLGVVSNEVVDLSGQLRFSCQLRLRVGSGQFHAQDAGSPRAGGRSGGPVGTGVSFQCFGFFCFLPRAPA